MTFVGGADRLDNTIPTKNRTMVPPKSRPSTIHTIVDGFPKYLVGTSRVRHTFVSHQDLVSVGVQGDRDRDGDGDGGIFMDIMLVLVCSTAPPCLYFIL